MTPSGKTELLARDATALEQDLSELSISHYQPEIHPSQMKISDSTIHPLSEVSADKMPKNNTRRGSASHVNNKNSNISKDVEGEESETESLDEKSSFSSIPISVICPFPHYIRSNNSIDGQDTKAEINKKYLFTSLFELENHLKNEHSVVFGNLRYNTLFMQSYLDGYIETFNSNLLPSRSRNMPLSELPHHLNIISENFVPNSFEEFKDDKEEEMIYFIDPSESEFDKSLRDEIQKRTLSEILDLQLKERNNEAMNPRKCLFCSQTCPNRANLFSHMYKVHGFNIGLPDNLVKTDMFLNILQNKLDNLQCINCEKEFTSAMVLRKHMRKKKHFKINSKNHFYDQFYIVNYSEPGKDWEKLDQEKYESGDEATENLWDDWISDENEHPKFISLFDELPFSSFDSCLNYMKNEYNFDLELLQSNYDLGFYKLVSLINFIRLKTKENMCYQCDLFFGSSLNLREHLKTSKCVNRIPPSYSEIWTNPKYLIPTLEDDQLLSAVGTLIDEDDS
ncbi:Zinc finger protein 277 [Smittium mucronatum]|uniref:Zinc finger protein 277 n=1 Tax=Smittium mucronatum TaxID=133383 RepID=A0A1R0GYM0_9FUNG|nr:Zinc finger protein 277 [Smittium mucronatum]